MEKTNVVNKKNLLKSVISNFSFWAVLGIVFVGVIHSCQFRNLKSNLDVSYSNKAITELSAQLYKIVDSHEEEKSLKEECITYLIRYNVEHPDIVLRQIILESGNFKSNLFKTYNNGLGMNQPLVRNTTSLGATENGFATYSSLETMILDYKIWQIENAKGLNRNDYYNLLQKIYAEDKNYVTALKALNL